MVGFPNWPMGFFLLKMIILGCELGVPPFKETPIYVSFREAISLHKNWGWNNLTETQLSHEKKNNSYFPFVLVGE